MAKFISFKRHLFPLSVIMNAGGLFTRLTLSFRDVEEILAERGTDTSNEESAEGF